MKPQLFCAFMLLSNPALAEVEISFYSGLQSSPHSNVSGVDPTGAGDFDFVAGWEGKSLSMPPYYGVRGTIWTDNNIGFGLEFTHSKAYADDETLGVSGTSEGFTILEFTDGLNNLTFNVSKRWPNHWGRFSPYAGIGAGVIIPHVEVKTTATAAETHGYQFGGASMALMGGVSYELTDTINVFSEYKFTYSALDVDLDGGGNLKTDIITNALNLGMSYKF